MHNKTRQARIVVAVTVKYSYSTSYFPNYLFSLQYLKGECPSSCAFKHNYQLFQRKCEKCMKAERAVFSTVWTRKTSDLSPLTRARNSMRQVSRVVDPDPYQCRFLSVWIRNVLFLSFRVRISVEILDLYPDTIPLLCLYG